MRSIQRLILSILWLVSPLRADLSPTVVISQLHSTFIEIFNRGADAVSIDGWSVQYKSGNYVWQAVPLKGTLSPGQYYLIGWGPSGTSQADVSDFFSHLTFSCPALNLAGTVALVRSTTPLFEKWPSVVDVADMFGCGLGEAADGTWFPGDTPGPSSSGPQAAVRLGNGCVDSHNNATDFQLAPPAPRNSHSHVAPCSTVPSIRAGGIVNAASFKSGPVAPGELLSILGSNLGPSQGAGPQLTAGQSHVTTALAGLRVLFNGIAAPILFASAGQTNVVAPFELAGSAQTTVQVELNGVLSVPQTVPVAASAPGIFTLLGAGSGQVAALNQDNLLNSVDATISPGSIVVLYGTGAGQTSAAGENGKISTGTCRGRSSRSRLDVLGARMRKCCTLGMPRVW